MRARYVLTASVYERILGRRKARPRLQIRIDVLPNQETCIKKICVWTYSSFRVTIIIKWVEHNFRVVDTVVVLASFPKGAGRKRQVECEALGILDKRRHDEKYKNNSGK